MKVLFSGLLIWTAALLAGCSEQDAGTTALNSRDVSQVAEPEPPAPEEPVERVRRITFDHLKFEMEKGAKFKQRMLTEQITELFGKRIKVRGFLLPSYKRGGLTNFVLCRDNRFECCFGPGAPPYNAIVVDMIEGEGINYATQSITVEGTLSFQKFHDPLDGELRCIYHLDGVRAK